MRSIKTNKTLLRSLSAAFCLALFAPALASCGSDTLGVATTVVQVTPTNFATIPPVASTLPGTTTSLPQGAVGSESKYTVQQGDSPLAVANKYGIALTTLLAYNGWVSPAQFPYPGTVILIPAQAINPVNTTPAAGSTAAGTTQSTTAAAAVSGSGCGTRPAGTYVIQKNDSLYSIRKKFCVSLAALFGANGWSDSSVTLLVGKQINIPAAGS